MTAQQIDAGLRWSEILNRRYGWYLLLICLGVALHALDSLIVATMMPAIVAEIGGANLVAWTVTLYELGSIMAAACSGLITIRYGIRTPMVFATLLFASGCLLSAIANDMWVVLTGRLLQGIGGGGLLAMAFVASALLFPHRFLARVNGAASVFWGAAAFLGPLLGGLSVEFATWRTGFWIFALLAILLSVALSVKIPPGERPASGEATLRFPVRRLIYLFLGTIAIAYAGVEISRFLTPVLILLGFVLIALFLNKDTRSSNTRLLPSNPVSLRTPIGAALTMIFCLSAASIALSTYGVLLLGSLYGVSPLTAGYIIAVEAIAWSVASFAVSGLPEKHDRKMIRVGMLLVFAGITGLAYSVPFGPVGLTIVFASIEGVGFGIAWAFVQRQVCARVRPEEVELASSAIPTAQAVGYALGAAVLGIVANASGFGMGDENIHLKRSALAIFIACVPIALYGLVATYRFVGPRQDAGSGL